MQRSSCAISIAIEHSFRAHRFFSVVGGEGTPRNSQVISVSREFISCASKGGLLNKGNFFFPFAFMEHDRYYHFLKSCLFLRKCDHLFQTSASFRISPCSLSRSSRDVWRPEGRSQFAQRQFPNGRASCNSYIFS